MKKISLFVENSGSRILTSRQIVGLAHGVTIVFAEPQKLSAAVSGLTLVEQETLHFLLLRCIKNYHTAHPSEFSLSLLFDSEQNTAINSATPLSQSFRSGEQFTGIF